VLVGIGIPKIRINNNMIRWFKSSSEIATADRVMNEKLGGTSLLYLVASATEADGLKEPEKLRYLETLQHELESAPAVGKTTSVNSAAKLRRRESDKVSGASSAVATLTRHSASR